MLRTAIALLLVCLPAAAQPTSRPQLRPADPAATQAAEDFRRVVTELREQIKSLKAQNAKLEKDNAELRAKLSEAVAAAPKKGQRPWEILDAIASKKIVVGMTREEADGVAKARDMVYDKSVTEQSVRGKTVVREDWEFRKWLPGFAQNVHFEDGVVTRVEK
jgi:predicted RNase H-like nuclease (RuvC/YqgF family)